MQVHGPGQVVSENDVSAHLNNDFAVMNIGNVILFLYSPEECDWLIKAAVEAKRLLTPPQCDSVAAHSGRHCLLNAGHDEPHRSGQIVWGPGVTEPACPAVSGTGTVCAADRRSHAGRHRDINGFEWGGEDEEYPDVSGGGVPYPEGGETAAQALNREGLEWNAIAERNQTRTPSPTSSPPPKSPRSSASTRRPSPAGRRPASSTASAPPAATAASARPTSWRC